MFFFLVFVSNFHCSKKSSFLRPSPSNAATPPNTASHFRHVFFFFLPSPPLPHRPLTPARPRFVLLASHPRAEVRFQETVAARPPPNHPSPHPSEPETGPPPDRWPGFVHTLGHPGKHPGSSCDRPTQPIPATGFTALPRNSLARPCLPHRVLRPVLAPRFSHRGLCSKSVHPSLIESRVRVCVRVCVCACLPLAPDLVVGPNRPKTMAWRSPSRSSHPIVGRFHPADSNREPS